MSSQEVVKQELTSSQLPCICDLLDFMVIFEDSMVNYLKEGNRSNAFRTCHLPPPSSI